MSSNDQEARRELPAPELRPEMEDLAELVDDAAKALSIGGSLQSAGEFREAVDTLRHQLGNDEADAAE